MSSSSSSNPNDVELKHLPKACFWEFLNIHQWEGFWFEKGLIKPAITFRSHFRARDDDVILTSTMKTGTTWLKALSLSIMHKDDDVDLLTKESPHFHVPTVETTAYSKKPTRAVNILGTSKSPRLLHTHLPYALLPDSVKNSKCKIVYIARNPKDTLIAMWHFFNSLFGMAFRKPLSLEKAVDCFCSGHFLYGPYFDHVLQYWLESQKRPDKVLFVKYEDLQSDPKENVAKIAEFLGRSFLDEAELDEVLWRSSFERLKNLEVNKSGFVVFPVKSSSYFRKGEVGDWENYLTSDMAAKIDHMIRVKLEPFGLFF